MIFTPGNKVIKRLQTTMMYVQIPIFSGYANIAICPGHGTVCYMMDNVEKNQNLYSEMNAKSYTFLPFYSNHHYILYPTYDDIMDYGVLYFHSEEVMKKHILGHLGTEHVTGRSLSVSVSTVAAPSVTNPPADVEESQEIFHNTVSKNSNKVDNKKQNKITKKLKNNKKHKKISLSDTSSMEVESKNDSWNTVHYKKVKKTQKNIKKQNKINTKIPQIEIHNRFSLMNKNLETKNDLIEIRSTQKLDSLTATAEKQSR